MARITTTIWDLATAIYEAAEHDSATVKETERVAAEVLVDVLDRALLCAPQQDVSPALRVRRRALGLTA